MKVDTARVGTMVSVGAITFRAPKDWVSADSSARADARQLLAGDSEPLDDRALIFCRPVSQMVMVGRVWQKGSQVPQDFEGWAASRRAWFRTMHGNASFSEARLVVNGLPFLQMFAADSANVHFRLIFDCQPLVTLDYLLPQAAVGTELGAVESSIATIRKE